MKIGFTLSTAERIAIRRAAEALEIGSFDETAHAVLRDWLIGNGYLELPIDEETETMGSA